MANFVEVGRVVDLPPGRGTSVTVAGKDIALFNVDGTIYAMDDHCLHQAQSLGTSELRGKVVTCRGHGWRYDVTTGNTLHVEDYGVTTYPVKVDDGNIYVDPPDLLERLSDADVELTSLFAGTRIEHHAVVAAQQQPGCPDAQADARRTAEGR